MAQTHPTGPWSVLAAPAAEGTSGRTQCPCRRSEMCLGGRIGDPSKDLDDDIRKAKDGVERTVKAGEMGYADLDEKEC